MSAFKYKVTTVDCIQTQGDCGGLHKYEGILNTEIIHQCLSAFKYKVTGVDCIQIQGDCGGLHQYEGILNTEMFTNYSLMPVGL